MCSLCSDGGSTIRCKLHRNYMANTLQTDHLESCLCLSDHPKILIFPLLWALFRSTAMKISVRVVRRLSRAVALLLVSWSADMFIAGCWTLITVLFHRLAVGLMMKGHICVLNHFWENYQCLCLWAQNYYGGPESLMHYGLRKQM